jgi:hypothetical protein
LPLPPVDSLTPHRHCSRCGRAARSLTRTEVLYVAAYSTGDYCEGCIVELEARDLIVQQVEERAG